MHRNDERDAVVLSRQNPAEMGVPRMAMHDIGIDVRCVETVAAAHCAEGGAQALRTSEIGCVELETRNFKAAFVEALIAKAAHLDHHQLCQLTREITYVCASPAVNVWRIFVGEEKDLHAFKSRASLWLAFNQFAIEMLALLCGAYQQHRHIDGVPHFVRSRAVNNVADEPMAVSRHRDKIDIPFAGKFDDFVRRFP